MTPRRQGARDGKLEVELRSLLVKRASEYLPLPLLFI